MTIHPNAGLPNEMGGYDETPEYTASVLREFAEAGLVNLVVPDDGPVAMMLMCRHQPAVELVATHENVVILRTFSKIYGLSALRLG